jgi:hypothetical protein
MIGMEACPGSQHLARKFEEYGASGKVDAGVVRQTLRQIKQERRRTSSLPKWRNSKICKRFIASTNDWFDHAVLSVNCVYFCSKMALLFAPAALH